MLYLKLQKLKEYPKMIDNKMNTNVLHKNLVAFYDQIHDLNTIG
jgi:hypothetical protein